MAVPFSDTAGETGDHPWRLLAVNAIPSKFDSIVILYLILAFVALAALLQFLGVYREQIRRFNSSVVRRSLQLVTRCFETKYFHLRPNEIMTRAHINLLELVVRTTIDFFYDAPNLITFIIGLLQIVATYDPDHPLQAKKINLIALCVNYLYTMVREISMYQTALMFDESRNSRVYKLLSSNSEHMNSPTNEQLIGGHFTPILAKDLTVGDVIRLEYGESFPAECQVMQSSEANVLINTKEESGEDCSSIFSKGDTVPYGSRMSTQGASVVAQVSTTRNTITADGTHRRMERFPEHMNRNITIANLFALGLLSLVGGVCTAYVVSVSESANNGEIFTHFFSIIAQLNMLIPSMRWVILYFLFIFVLDAAYPSVTIQSHAALRRLDEVEVIYSDKTGTLTDTRVDVEALQLLPGLDKLVERVGLSKNILAALIVMACNDTQPGNGEGTSPEEMVIAEYLRTSNSFQTWIEKNPLKPKNTVQRLTVHGQSVVVSILNRSQYIPCEFCRISDIKIGDIILKVRQGGSDRMALFTNDRLVIKEEAMTARNNPNRAFGWTVTVPGEESISLYCIRATFTNPPRPSSADLVSFASGSRKIAVRMLTGDGLEAAKYIAATVGIMTGGEEEVSVLHQDFSEDFEFVDAVNAALSTTSGWVTVIIEGSCLLRLINSDKASVDFLKSKRVNMVIYRTKSADKALIVRHASETLGMGAMMIGDAANDKHVLALPSIVSVSLRHGAAPCRVVSDIIISEPGDLVDLWTCIKNLHLSGGKALLLNTCLIGSVVSGLTLVGIAWGNFKLLPKGFLYADPYDTRLMLIFSSLLYAPSACAAIMGGFSSSSSELASISIRSLGVLIAGLLFGMIVGFVGPRSAAYSQWMLITMILVGMGSHAMLAGRNSRFNRPRDGSGDRIGVVVDLVNKRWFRGGLVIVYTILVLLVS